MNVFDLGLILPFLQYSYKAETGCAVWITLQIGFGSDFISGTLGIATFGCLAGVGASVGALADEDFLFFARFRLS